MWLPGLERPLSKSYYDLGSYQKDVDALAAGEGVILVRECKEFEEHIRASAVMLFRMEVYVV